MDLRTYLFKNRISQVDFARMLGVARPTMNCYLSGKFMPSESTVKKIEKLTDGKVTVKDLRRGKPFRDYICPTCKCRRRVKRKPKQGDLFQT